MIGTQQTTSQGSYGLQVQLMRNQPSSISVYVNTLKAQEPNVCPHGSACLLAALTYFLSLRLIMSTPAFLNGLSSMCLLELPHTQLLGSLFLM